MSTFLKKYVIMAFHFNFSRFFKRLLYNFQFSVAHHFAQCLRLYNNDLLRFTRNLNKRKINFN